MHTPNNDQNDDPILQSEDRELILLDRILHETSDYVFPMDESDPVATDQEVARLRAAIAASEESQTKARSKILTFPQKLLAVAASFFYMAGGFMYFALRHARSESLAYSIDHQLDHNLLGHTAPVDALEAAQPERLSYVPALLLILVATGLLILLVRSKLKHRKQS